MFDAFGTLISTGTGSVDATAASVPQLDWAILEAITARIMAEVPGICRVAYDLSPKPIACIECE